MKKIIVALILLFSINVLAQDYSANSQSTKNSTTTTLDSNATFTGATELSRGYNSVSVTVRSDSSGTYKILFGNTSTFTVANAVKTYLFSYTLGDTLTNTKTVPVDAPYFRVVYTSSADTQHTFILTTMLNKGHVLPITSAGKLDVNSSITGTVTVAADAVTFGVPKTTLEYIASATAYPTELFGGTDTVTTRIDTTTFAGHDSYVEGYIQADDSIEVSINPAFTSGKTWPITVTTPVPIKWAINQQWTSLYIRRYGSAGTPRFYLRLSAY